MTTEPRFLVLVAKVDEAEELVRYLVDTYANMAQSSERFLFFPFRALKGEIIRHEPRHYAPGFRDVKGTLHHTICGECSDMAQEPYKFPCQPWLDMEAEVGK